MKILKSVTMDRDVDEALKKKCKELGISQSSFVQSAIVDKLFRLNLTLGKGKSA